MSYFLNAVVHHYADFSGRARRKEYFLFVLFSLIVGFVAWLIDGMLIIFDRGFPIVSLLWQLFLFLPGWAVAVRRLHDVGKSGWFLLIALIPVVGSIWLFVLYCTDGQPGINAYGPNPKELQAQAGRPPYHRHEGQLRNTVVTRDAYPLERKSPVVRASRTRYFIQGQTGDGSTVHVEIPGGLLAQEGAVLGRSSQSSNLVVNDSTLSRRHARLYSEANSLYVEDLESTNGTRINGILLNPRTPTPVRQGDEIAFGAVRVRLSVDS